LAGVHSIITTPADFGGNMIPKWMPEQNWNTEGKQEISDLSLQTVSRGSQCDPSGDLHTLFNRLVTLMRRD
jgi:hypothetical protein